MFVVFRISAAINWWTIEAKATDRLRFGSYSRQLTSETTI